MSRRVATGALTVTSSGLVRGSMRRARKGLRTRNALLLIGAAASASTLLLGASTATGSAAVVSHKTDLQKGMEFYRGKAITLMVGSAAGGSYDEWGRALAPYIAAYLHATVNVTNPPAGVSLPTYADEIAAAPSNGLYVGVQQLFNSTAGTLLGTPQVNYNINREAWIASFTSPAQLILSNPALGITSIAALKAYTGTVKVIDGISTSSSNILVRAFLGLLGVNAQFVQGYATPALQIAGFVRGDAPLDELTFANSSALLQEGKAIALGVSAYPPKGTVGRGSVLGAPTWSQIFEKYPVKTKLQKQQLAAMLALASGPFGALTLPTATSDPEVLAMRAAVSWAYHKSAGFKQQLSIDGISPKFLNPVQAKSAYAKSVIEDKSLAFYVNG